MDQREEACRPKHQHSHGVHQQQQPCDKTTCSSSSRSTGSLFRVLSWLKDRKNSGGSWAFETSSSQHSSSDKPTKSRFGLHNLFGSSASPVPPVVGEETRASQLERSLKENAEFCDELISALLAAHVPAGHLKVRFVQAVSEFEASVNRRERLAKGTKIVTLFARGTSRFRISSLNPHLRMGQLKAAKQQILFELSADPVVIRFLQLEAGSPEASADRQRMEDVKLI